MATLLRKVKSTIHATTSNVYTPSNNRSQHHIDLFGRTRQRRRSSEFDNSNELSHPSHSNLQEQPELGQHISLAELRRRLVHKASTINLRSKNRRGGAEEVQKKKSREQEQLQKRVQLKEPEHTVQQVQDETQKDPSRKSNNENRPANQPDSDIEENSKGAKVKDPAEVFVPARPYLPKNSSVQVNKPRVGDCIEEHNKETSPTAKMSAEASTPPVPFARLKEISDGACSSVFSNVTLYDHSSTETWNTTIINAILGTLVKETTPTPSATTSSSQPQFKYIVNSTIIQHAPTSSGDEPNPAASGRRGMHAASGAYWNNERDGMFSYKYEAAESKGLDVIIGITWIWIG